MDPASKDGLDHSTIDSRILDCHRMIERAPCDRQKKARVKRAP